MKIKSIMKNFILSSTAFCLCLTNFAVSSEKSEEKSPLPVVKQQNEITQEEFLKFLKSQEFSVKDLKQEHIQRDLPGFLTRLLEALVSKKLSKKTVASMKQFDICKEDYILICERFFITYTQQLRKTEIHCSQGVYHRSLDDITHHRAVLEPYYKYMQWLTTEYMTKKEIFSTQFKSDLEHQEQQPLLIASDGAIDITVFKDEQGYNPIVVYKLDPFHFKDVHYGQMTLPLKMFGYHNGEIVLDSGIYLSKTQNSIKMTFYNGQYAFPPFTYSRKTVHLSGKSARTDLLNDILNVGKNDRNFIPFPTIEQEKNLFHLLLLEELIAASKNPILENQDLSVTENKKNQSSNVLSILPSTNSSSQMWADLQASDEEPLTREDDMSLLLKQTKSEVESDFDLSSQQMTLISKQDDLEEKGESAFRKKNKKKTRGKAFKGGKGKDNNNSQQTSSSSAKTQKCRQAQADHLKDQLKQKGRIKYKSLLKLLNEVYKNASPESLENLKKSMCHGSHHGLHLEDGKGLTIVRKHSTGDLTLPASAANRLIEGLIDILFGTK